MKNQNIIKLAGILMGALLACGQAMASNILQTATEGAGVDWTAASWGPGPFVATSGNIYECPSSAFTVRTPNKNLTGLYSTNFAGSGLQIDAGGILYLKHGGNLTNAAVCNLTLNGGTMTYHGGFAPVPAPMGGTLQVPVNSTINSDQTGASGSSGADIWMMWPVSGSGNLSVNMDTKTNALVLYGTNTSYSGNWTNITGIIKVGSGSVNALGSGAVLLNFATSTFLLFDATNGSMIFNNAIAGIGNVIKMNTNTVVLAGNNTYTGMTTISNGVLQIGSGATLTNSSAIALLNGATLDASLIGGLTLSTVGEVMTNCNGTVNGGLTAATTNVLNFNVSASTNDILNVGGSLTLNGNPRLNVSVAGYKPTGSYRLINYTGTIQGGGSFTLTGTNASSETFSVDTSTAGQVNLVVVGATYNITWAGDNAANNWDFSSANWTGGTNTYSDGDTVSFTDAGSASPAINIAAIVHPASVAITNNSNFYTFNGSGIVTTGSFIKDGSNEVDLNSSGNNFSGPVTIQNGTLSIGNGSGGAVLGTPTVITNNGLLKVNLPSAGAAIQCPITGTGAVYVTGANTVVLGGTNTYTGQTTVDPGCQLNITSGSALGSTSAGTTVNAGGRLGVATLVGNMTIPEPVTVNGQGIGTAPGALYCNTVGNNVTYSGPITIATDSRFRVVNNGVQLNFSNTVQGTNVNLECTAGTVSSDTATTMNFQNTLALGSGTLTVDDYGVVILGGSTTCGSTVVTADNSANSLLAAGPITLLVNGNLNGGPVSVDNTTTLGGSGTIQGTVTMDGTLAPGTATTTATLTVNNTVTLNSDATTTLSLNRTNVQNASKLAGTSISLGGLLNVTNVGPALLSGDTFHLFSGSLSGVFATTNLPALSTTNLSWDVSQLNSSGIIKVAGGITATNPVINHVTVSGTNLMMQVVSQDSSLNYVLQATPQLVPASWSNIQTNSGAGGSTLNFSTPISPANPQRFFRLSVQ
ncbi:MAG TPA: autotransporter-associated beta strand repeat-containing protein [Candidatus Sulfotelmatobacter sp.]|jgi:fibronectin-binding autotransporter adhesin|nr:autotransporter-associated beta strand repeat-containing protein [Candidatus Sulfotelmatobacter sp.]